MQRKKFSPKGTSVVAIDGSPLKDDQENLVHQSKSLVSKKLVSSNVVVKRRIQYQQSASKVLTDARKDLKMLCSGDRWDDFVTNKNSIKNSRGQERKQEQQNNDSSFGSESLPESIQHSDNTPSSKPSSKRQMQQSQKQY